nr:major facilitator superfamily domain-containing protein 6 [Osmia lignaria]XP_034183929.1 major facilitator superfamily domain-containing protein 6 [Osmia lignaria]XP_034183937.1 major facilitator superfamily domain-containing protein 6 [Osmia lignaria]XP_034183947.1 major facilitator superfamily domain-containing protein 6 [Osmia lignaria]XP_034183956.1 major facilitator superfamily domain-containing protein 6 [Osmia lignaria]XP_034183966.1 major facilitator superfamily domain-containing pr
MFENINRELLPIKAHYFLFNAATGPIVPFLPTIAKQLGFSGILVGTIYTILPVSGLVAKPLFGGLADKFKIHKPLFLLFQAVVAIAMFTILFIPEIDRSANVTLNCLGEASLEICSKNEFSSEVIHSVISEKMHTNTSCHVSCKATKDIYTELCLHWKASEFCKLLNSNISDTDTFDFNMRFDIFHDIHIGKCIYIHNFTAMFSNDEAYKPHCANYVKTFCKTICHNNPAFNQLLEEAEVSQNSTQTSSYQFQSFLWATIISWIGMAVVVSIADAICFNLLGNDRRKEYGKQKMWGSIGFGIFGISAGYLVDVFSEGRTQKDYSCIFYIMLIMMIFDIIVSATLRKKNPDCSEDEPSIFQELFTIFKEGNVLAFGWWCIGAGMCTSVIWNFLFWYTEDLATGVQITWLKTLQGLLTGIQCFVGELPFNFISGTVLRKLGHVNVMSLVLLIYAIRFMAYSTVSNPWWFLIIEVLHGPSLGLCWPTMVSYGDKVTPPGTKATIQGFIGAVFEGIGVSCGSLICGWLMDTYGGVTTMRVFSVGALLWLTCFWFILLLVRKLKVTPLHLGHNHLVNYANPDDAILLTMNRELQTY